MLKTMAIFEDYHIRRVYDDEAESWLFSVADIIQVLLQHPDYQTAKKYWNKLKERLKKEGNESVTDCHQLKLKVRDGKFVHLTLTPSPSLFQRGELEVRG